MGPSSVDRFNLWGSDSDNDNLEPAERELGLGLGEGEPLAQSAEEPTPNPFPAAHVKGKHRGGEDLWDKHGTSADSGSVDYRALYELQLEKTRELQRTIMELKREVKLLKEKPNRGSSNVLNNARDKHRIEVKSSSIGINDEIAASAVNNSIDSVRAEWDRIVLEEKNRKKSRPVVSGNRRRHRITAPTAAINSVTAESSEPSSKNSASKNKMMPVSDLWSSSDDEDSNAGSNNDAFTKSIPVHQSHSKETAAIPSFRLGLDVKDSASSGWDSSNFNDSDSGSNDNDSERNPVVTKKNSNNSSTSTNSREPALHGPFPPKNEQEIERAVLSWSASKCGQIVALLQSVKDVFHGVIDESAANICKGLTVYSSPNDVRKAYLMVTAYVSFYITNLWVIIILTNYKQLVKQIHPDKQGSGAPENVRIEAVKVFAALSDAYSHYKAISTW